VGWPSGAKGRLENEPAYCQAIFRGGYSLLSFCADASVELIRVFGIAWDWSVLVIVSACALMQVNVLGPGTGAKRQARTAMSMLGCAEHVQLAR
jgi:hypothetical protein